MQFLFERRCCLAITAAAALVVAGAGLGARDCTSTLALFQPLLLNATSKLRVVAVVQLLPGLQAMACLDCRLRDLAPGRALGTQKKRGVG